mgnify:FL=1
MIEITARQFKKLYHEGKIENPQDYIASGQHIRKILAKKGECVDELVKYDEDAVKIKLIDNGHGQEYYPQWCTHQSSWHIRMALARKGYCPDILIHDDIIDVQSATLYRHPELANEFIKDELTIAKVKELSILYFTGKCRDKDVAKTVIDKYPELIIMTAPMKGLFDTSPQTTIEKTLTTKQSYELGYFKWVTQSSTEIFRRLLYVEDKCYHENKMHIVSEIVPDAMDTTIKNIQILYKICKAQ